MRPFLALGLEIVAAGMTSAFRRHTALRSCGQLMLANSVAGNTSVWVRSGISLALLQIRNLNAQYAGILTLGRMRSTAEVGLYKVAYHTASLMPFGLMALNTAIAQTPVESIYSRG